MDTKLQVWSKLTKHKRRCWKCKFTIFRSVPCRKNRKIVTEWLKGK